MAEGSMQEKTEDATPKKREKAREEGDVGKSVEIPSVFVLAGGVASIYAASGFMYKHTMAVMHDCFHFISIPDFTITYSLELLYKYSLSYFLIFSPILLAVFIMALASNMYMVGFVISWKAIGLKWNKIDPVAGLKKKFSLSSLVELLKSIAKLSVIGTLAWLAVKSEMDQIRVLYTFSVGQILIYLLKVIFKIFIWVIIPMAAVAIVDYLYQKWQFDQKLKMTKQEVKDENKQTEGDPQVKSRIKTLQYEAARKRMMAEVPKADVIITNPTHFAVAVKYEAMKMTAPRVVAKGAGPLALKIKALAKEADIPIVENKQLARNLYKIVEVGDEVPVDYYRAIAEVLAYVYRMKGRRS